MEDYRGHLRDFRRLLANLDAQTTLPFQKETIAALSQRIARDEAHLTTDQLERSVLATVESTGTLPELQRTEQEVVAYVREVTTRRRRELETTRFREAIDYAGELIFIVEPFTGRFADVNRTASDVLGYSREELLELSLGQIEIELPLAPATAWQEWVAKLRNGVRSSLHSGTHRRRDGSRFSVDLSVGFAAIADQELLLIVSRDNTERRRRDSRLMRQWAFFSHLVQRSVDGIFAFDKNKTLTYWNPAMEQMLGKAKSEALGRSVFEVIPQWKELGEGDYLDQALAGQNASSRNRPLHLGGDGADARRLVFDGYYAPLTGHDSKNVLGGIAFIRDVTHRRESEENQLRETIQKLEKQRQASETVMAQLREEVRQIQVAETVTLFAQPDGLGDTRPGSAQPASNGGSSLDGVELVAGGVSREIHRLMNGILGQAGLAIAELPLASPLRPQLQSIEEAAMMASELGDRLKSFATGTSFKREPVKLNGLIEGLHHTLKAIIDSEAKLEFHIPEPPGPQIQGDSSSLRDLVIELVTNASDALIDADGVIEVRTGVRRFDAAALKQVHYGESIYPGTFAFIEVRDNGSGMDLSTRSKCLVPFFGTKLGRPGLGLATVLGIVRSHDAALLIDSELDDGTSIKVLFPISDASNPPRQHVGEGRISE